MNADDLSNAVISQLLLAKELDTLHLSLINLRNLAAEGEIDLVLDQVNKSTSQKSLFLEKILKDLPSLPLRKSLMGAMQSEGLGFFAKQRLTDTVSRLQAAAEHVQVLKLNLATEFKEKELHLFATTLANKLGRPVVLELTVQKELLGGVVIQYGAYISDYSMRSRLQQFSEHWESAVVEAT